MAGPLNNVEYTKCDGCYIGETGWTLKTRMGEHEKSARDRNYKSALSQHQLDLGHKIDFNSVKVIQQVKDLKPRKVAEAIQIRIRKPALNRDQGMTSLEYTTRS